jgi:hypothetical protein
VDHFLLADRPVDDAQVHDDAAELVVDRVEDQAAQRGVRIAFGMRDLRDELVEQLLDAFAALRRDAQGVRRVDPDRVLDLLADDLGGARGGGRSC